MVDFGLQDDILEENGFSWRPPIRDNCIHTPSTIPLPESVADAMFHPPEGFGPSYLYDRLGEDNGVVVVVVVKSPPDPGKRRRRWHP
jgi:hypothetical protein